MKTKESFVTNSSSTSYIIEGIDKNILVDICRKMTDIVLKEFFANSPTKDYIRKVQSNVEAIKVLRDVMDGTIGITFPSINRDTFIIVDKTGNRIIVETCNNHIWDIDILMNDDSVGINKENVWFYNIFSGKIIRNRKYTKDYEECVCESLNGDSVEYLNRRPYEKEE